MKALIVKDLCLLAKTCRLYVVVALIYVAVGIFTGTDFSMVMVVISGMLPVTLYALDERAHWDAFALALPMDRKTIVRERYVMLLLVAFMGTVLGMLISLCTLIKKGGSIMEIFSVNGAGFLAACFFASLALPVVFKMGTEKARLVLMLCFGLPVIGGTFLISSLENSAAGLAAARWLPFILPIATAACLLVSYSVSQKIFQKKAL